MPAADTPLAGLRILVTRPESQAAHLVHTIRLAGGEPISFPTLAIEPLAPTGSQIQHLAQSEAVVFISTNAVKHGYPVLRRLADANRRIFAIGEATKHALQEAGCRNVHGPAGAASSSEELLEQPWLKDVANRRICIVRGRGGREELKRVLASRGARVTYLECYRRRLPSNPDTDVLARALDHDHKPLVVATTSVEGLSNLLKLVPEEYGSRLRSRPLIVVGNRQKKSALQQGWAGPVLESPAGDEQIVDTLIAWCDSLWSQ